MNHSGVDWLGKNERCRRNLNPICRSYEKISRPLVCNATANALPRRSCHTTSLHAARRDGTCHGTVSFSESDTSVKQQSHSGPFKPVPLTSCEPPCE